MREKYNVFDVSKINQKTIDIALTLKDKSDTDFSEAFLKQNLTPGCIPYDKNDLLEYLSVKYLQLAPEHGIPLLKEAFKQQYNVEDEFKKCCQCGKPFQFNRRSSKFCSSRCRQRFYRDQKRAEKRSRMLR